MQPFDLQKLIVSLQKYLNLPRNALPDHHTGSNFRIGFALSNRPHFNSAYLLRVLFSSGFGVKLVLWNKLQQKVVDMNPIHHEGIDHQL